MQLALIMDTLGFSIKLHQLIIVIGLFSSVAVVVSCQRELWKKCPQIHAIGYAITTN